MPSPEHHRRQTQNAACRRTRWLVRASLLALLGLLAYQSFWGFHLRRFAVVEPGVLYRSGQPTAWGLRYLIRRYGVRTVVSLRGRSREALRRGMTDLGVPNGPAEAQLVRSLGARYLHWPMGQESYWPWLPPSHFERFFALMDNPRNLPVAVHCIAGRHRTGTFVALFRMEYHRWSAEEALLEMQRFDFGHPVFLQEHNLRTYWPRPWPDPKTFRQLQQDWSALLPPGKDEDYRRWIWRVRERIAERKYQRHLRYWLRHRGGFALCVAHRLVDRVDEETQRILAAEAFQVLQAPEELPSRQATAAALVADYGTRQEQRWLLAWLRREIRRKGPVTPRYHAVVQGLTNRYTMNRIPYWNALLQDTRRRPEPDCRKYRYCDTAAARLFCTVPEPLAPYAESWEQIRYLVRRWLQRHPETLRLRPVADSAAQQASAPAGAPALR